MRNWFTIGLRAVTIVLGITGTAAAAPVTAITLSAGDSATFNFDFVNGGVTPAPPYAEIILSGSYMDLDSGDSGTLQFWSDLDASGTPFLTVNDPGLLPGLNFPNIPFTNDGIFSMTIAITAGSLTLFDPAATGFDAEGTGTLVLFGEQAQQVPEPATMMLLGLGVASVTMGRRRRRHSTLPLTERLPMRTRLLSVARAPVTLMLALSAPLMVAAPAAAAPITYTFTGSVDTVDPGLTDKFWRILHTVSGSITYDNALNTDLDGSGSGRYNALTAFTLDISGYQGVMSVGSVDILSNLIYFRASAVTGASFPSGGLNQTWTPYSMFVALSKNVSTDALPADLSGWSPHSWFFMFEQEFGDRQVVRGNLLTVNQVETPVPEPATLSLLAFGLSGLAAHRLRRRCRPRS